MKTNDPQSTPRVDEIEERYLTALIETVGNVELTTAVEKSTFDEIRTLERELIAANKEIERLKLKITEYCDLLNGNNV